MMKAKELKEYLNTVDDQAEIRFSLDTQNIFEEYHDIENVLEVHMDFRETGKYNAVYLISSEN